MMDRLAHRGPDDEGIDASDWGVLGHRRLAIIDVDHGAQPISSPDRRYRLVYNGEIYNYLELRQRLIQRGVSFESYCDTEVLLYALIEYGVDALAELNGMFAFALLDTHTGEWMMARDPFGIKPLYYAAFEDEVVFASEIKALLLHPRVRREIDPEALQQYLTLQFCLGERTLFAKVRKIEPGFYLRGRWGKVTECVRYWDTNFEIDEHHTETYFVDRLLSLLQDSARLQIRSDVPVGAYLSGGLDSTIVASMAADHLDTGIDVFTGKFAEGPAYDESRYAHLVAGTIGARMHEIVPSGAEFADVLPNLIYHMDEPVAGPGLFPQYMVSREAASHVKVILGGQGGDEIFGGYARYLIGYLEQALKGGIFETQEEGKHLVSLASIIPELPVLQTYRPLMQNFFRDGLFGEMDARYFRLIDRSPDIAALLSPDARNSLNREVVFAAFQGVFNHSQTQSYFNKMTHFDLKTLLPALLQVEDRVSMAVSLESRVPLLDRRVVDLVTSMPPQMKFNGGKSKYILKEAVANLIPRDVLNRKDKMGFPVPLTEWMKGGPVRELVHDVLLGQRSRTRGLFDTDALEGLVQTETRFGRQLWGALCLELWMCEFIDA